METSELLQVLRERLSISLSIETDWECGGEYASISVSLEFTDDEGERHTISHDYDSVCIDRDR